MTRLPALGWIWIALVVPSLDEVHRYVGWPGAAAYAVIVAVVLRASPRLLEAIPSRRVPALALATWLLVVTMFLVMHPIANTQEPGRGSDDDDAYNTGVAALLSLESPYSRSTYLGNPLHQLPGAFVVAVPFVLAGTSALQNLFWLPLFFVVTAKESRDPRIPLWLAWLVLALSPMVAQQVITGTGHSANAVYVLLGLWWIVRGRHRAVASAAWGVALASRANFAFLLPVVFGWLYQRFGWRVAVPSMALTSAVFVALSLPFYLYHGENFGPLAGYSRLGNFDEVIPYLGTALVAAAGVLSMALAATRMDFARLLRNCAVIVAFPIVAGTIAGSVLSREFDSSLLPYGVFVSWFVLMALVVYDAEAQASSPTA